MTEPLTDEELADIEKYGVFAISPDHANRLVTDLRVARAEVEAIKAENQRLREAISAMRQGLA